MDKKILVIIPCYNEEDNIVNTVENLRAVCPEVDFLVVNDCSTDSSADLLRSHHYPFLDLPVNLGIGGNVHLIFGPKWQNDFTIRPIRNEEYAICIVTQPLCRLDNSKNGLIACSIFINTITVAVGDVN